MHSLKTKEWKQFMQWWPVTCRHSWSNFPYYGHIRTYSSCIPQPVSWGKSDLFDSTWVWLCRCYIYSLRAVKFFSHMLEKTWRYVTVRISISRSTDELRAEKRGVVQVTDDSRVFLTVKPASTHFCWGLRDLRHFVAPTLHQERVGGGMKTDLHTQKSSRNETWIDKRLQGPSYFSSVFTFLGPGCENTADDGLQCMR